MSLKKNIIANYVGQIWMSILSFIFFPIYIKYLGMESYGIISIFTFWQVALNVLLGSISPALSREFSNYSAGARTKESTANLLRSMEYITLAICFFFVAIIYFSSDFISKKWLNVESLPFEIVAESLQIGALLIVIRFIENIYSSSLIGLQKQVTLNLIQILGYSLKNIGVIFALCYISPTIKCFCYWQICSFIFMAVLEGIYTYKNLSTSIISAKFSKKELEAVFTFSSQSLLNSFVAFLGQQSDKLILSKFLTLTDFGNYSLAISITNIILAILSPISQAFYPHIVALRTTNNHTEAGKKFHQCCQLISIFCGISIFCLIFFSDNLISIWTNNLELTSKVAPIVKVLAVSMLITAITHFTTALPFIAGKPMTNVKANLYGFISILLFSLPLIKNFGIKGALAGSLVYNITVFLFFPKFFNNYLKEEQNYWLINDVIKPISINLLFFFILSLLLEPIQNNIIVVSILVIFSCCLALLNLFLCPDLKSETIKFLKTAKITRKF